MTTPTPETVLEVHDLHRRFGPVYAVRGVSFSLLRGQIAGFVGVNGAGKTTTLRLLATLDFPHHGTIRIEGADAILEPEVVRARIGWMPDQVGTYDNLTVCEYLEFFARAYGLRGGSMRQRIDDMIAFVGLEQLTARPSTRLSKGEAQRLSLARTLLQNPSVLLLDEPAAGLDPRARIEIRRLLRILKEQGKTLLLSSHILADLEEICDQLIFIDKGRILRTGSPAEISAALHTGQRLRVRLAQRISEWQQWVQFQPGAKLEEPAEQGGTVLLEAAEPAAAAEFLRRAVQAGYPVHDFQRLEHRLEDAFLHLLENRREAQPLVP